VVIGDAEVIYEMPDAGSRVGWITRRDDRNAPAALAQSGDGERSDD